MVRLEKARLTQGYINIFLAGTYREDSNVTIVSAYPYTLRDLEVWSSRQKFTRLVGREVWSVGVAVGG